MFQLLGHRHRSFENKDEMKKKFEKLSETTIGTSYYLFFVSINKTHSDVFSFHECWKKQNLATNKNLPDFKIGPNSFASTLRRDGKF